MEDAKPVVLVTSPRFLRSEQWGMKLLRESGFEPIYDPDFEVPEQTRKQVNAIVLADQLCNAERIAMFPNLRVIARTGTGHDNIDLQAAKERGIVVIRISRLNHEEVVSELVLGLILCLSRNIILAHNYFVRDQQWDEARKPGRSLPELTIGIVGLGAIGRALGGKLHSLGTKEILGWNRTSRDEVMDAANKHCIRLMSLDELMTNSDVVIVCLALQKGERGTERIISRERLGKMKEGSLFINASRGEVVDEEALADYVVEGKIGGVALDVYSEEPPFDQSFFKKLESAVERANIILTPHIGAVTEGSDKNMSLQVARNIIAVVEGKLEGLEIVSQPLTLETQK